MNNIKTMMESAVELSGNTVSLNLGTQGTWIVSAWRDKDFPDFKVYCGNGQSPEAALQDLLQQLRALK